MKAFMKNLYLIGIILAVSLMCSCEKVTNIKAVNAGTNSNSTYILNSADTSNMTRAESTLAQNDKQDDSINIISRVIDKFYQSIEAQDSRAFKQIVDKDGFEFMRIFTSGNGTRGKDIWERIGISQIPDDLVFNLVQNEYPISLKGLFQYGIKEFSEMEIINYEENFDWDKIIKLEIHKMCGKIAIDKNKFVGTNIYILKDGSFFIGQFGGSGLAYSQWVFFKKEDDNYFLKIIAIFY